MKQATKYCSLEDRGLSLWPIKLYLERKYSTLKMGKRMFNIKKYCIVVFKNNFLYQKLTLILVFKCRFPKWHFPPRF